MKINTLGENPKTIFENKNAISRNALMKEALAYGITDFTDVDFTLFDLEGITFSNCVFTRANFNKARLQKTIFDTCHFEDATFNHCPTYRTVMRQCNLDYTKWEQTHAGQISMDSCTLKGANIVDLGMTARGYKVVLSYENGQAIITGGCRQLTLQEAKEQYPETNNDEEGARVTLARRIAYQRGWLAKSTPVPMVIEPHDSICQGDPDPEPQVDKLKVEEIVESFDPVVEGEKVLEEIKEHIAQFEETPTDQSKEVAETVNA